MIENFEEYTSDLTIEELSYVPFFVESFSKKIGKEKAVTNKQIIERLAEKKKIYLTESRVRKIINYIRNGNLVMGLVASACGYYVTTDIQELKEYAQSLGHREAAIGSIRKRIEDYIAILEKRKTSGNERGDNQ